VRIRAKFARHSSLGQLLHLLGRKTIIDNSASTTSDRGLTLNLGCTRIDTGEHCLPCG
jgi:hypothetical protein